MNLCVILITWEWNLITCWHLTSIFVEVILSVFHRLITEEEPVRLRFISSTGPPSSHLHQWKDCVCVFGMNHTCWERLKEKRGFLWGGVWLHECVSDLPWQTPNCSNCTKTSSRPRPSTQNYLYNNTTMHKTTVLSLRLCLNPLCWTRPGFTENDITSCYHGQHSKHCHQLGAWPSLSCSLLL